MAINIQKRIRFIEEYRKNMGGNVTKCCRVVGVSRMRYYQWLKAKKKIIDGKTFAEIIHEIDQQILDDAEQIYKGIAIIEKDKTALFNFLRKKHPDWRDEPVSLGIREEPITIKIVNGNRSNNSVPEKLEQQKEDSSQSGVNEKQ